MKQLLGPSAPRFLQRLQWIFDPISYLENTKAQFPDIFQANSLGFGGSSGDIVLTSHPQALQQLLTSDRATPLRDRKQFSAPGEMNMILKPLLGDASVIMIDGDRHRKRRQLVMPSFHGERLKAYGDLIIDITHKVLQQIPPGQSFLARDITQTISLEVIFQTVFGFREGENSNRIKTLLTAMADLFRSPLTSSFLFFPGLQKDLGPWSPWGRFVRQRQELNELLYAAIADRRANPDPTRTDILTMLLEAKDEAGEPMTDQELRDELMTILFAGHETTATVMAWALYWLHYKPETKTKLLAELDSLDPKADGMQMNRLPYLNAVCNETMRIYPVAMLTFPRQVEEAVEMLGYTLKPGTVIMGSMYLTHQREDLYPNHKEFKPDRFLERQYSAYEFIPFGGGARRCLGEALAQFEMKLAIATIMSHYQLALADSRPEKPRRRGVTLAPTRGVKMVMQGKRLLPTSVFEKDLIPTA
jgi:cytochrome P450